MAWYTSRICNNENDTEMRHSARSLTSSTNGGGIYFNLSSRSFDTSKTTSVRYSNSAAFIENNMPQTNASQDSYVNSSTMSETQSDIVPPLDLKSEENYPTNRDYTFSYHKHYEAPKIELNPNQAYETWLSAKKKLLSDEANRRKKAEELKQREIEERKRLAKEQYEKWLEKKSHTSLSQQSVVNTSSNTCEQRSHQLSAEEAQSRLEEWERTKRLEDERRRMMKREEEKRRRELEEQRRQLATEAWEKWIANADKKPKPVPLNRGIFTLRGTVSDIFINPVEWKSIVPTNNEEI